MTTDKREDEAMADLIQTAESLVAWNEKRRTLTLQRGRTSLPDEVDAALRGLASALDHLPVYYKARYCHKRLSDDELPLLERSIQWLDLSIRTCNSLTKAHLLKIGDLTETRPEEVLNIRQFGKKQLNEIRTRLAEHGLHLKYDYSALDGRPL